MRLERASAHAALALVALVACSPAGQPTSSVSPPSSAPPLTRTALPSGASASPAAAFRQNELVKLEFVPIDIAASGDQVFVAEVAAGARPAETRARIIVAGPQGATATVLPGSETPAGISVMGLALRGAELYLSRVSATDLSQTGVFRLLSGQLTPIAGGRAAALGPTNGDGGPATSAVVQAPWGIAFANDGDLLIAENADSRIRRIHAGVITTVAGNGSCAATPPASGPASAAAICNPGTLAVTTDGAIYAAQRNGAHWIIRVDPSGTLTTVATGFPIGGMAADADGSLLVADANGALLRYSNARTGPERVVSGLGLVRALARAPDGSLYVARSTNGGGTWTLVRVSLP